MTQEELNSSVRGYVAGNVVAKLMANDLEKRLAKSEEYQRLHPYDKDIRTALASYVIKNDTESAVKYLEDLFITELIAYAQTQEKEPMCLPNRVTFLKDKYRPFFEVLSLPFPDTLNNVTAESITRTLGISVLRDHDLEPDVKGDTNHTGCIGFFCGVLILAMIIGMLLDININH